MSKLPPHPATVQVNRHSPEPRLRSRHTATVPPAKRPYPSINVAKPIFPISPGAGVSDERIRLGTAQPMKRVGKELGNTHKLKRFCISFARGKCKARDCDVKHAHIQMNVSGAFENGVPNGALKFRQLASDAYRVFSTEDKLLTESMLAAFRWDNYDENSLTFGKDGFTCDPDSPGWSGKGLPENTQSVYHIFAVKWTMTCAGISLLPDNEFYIPFAHVVTDDGADVMYPDCQVCFENSRWTYTKQNQVFDRFDDAAQQIVDRYQKYRPDAPTRFDLRALLG